MAHDAVTTLFREIGIADTVGFLHQFSLGSGDYSRDRKELLGEPSLEEILGEIRERRARKEP